MAEGDSARKILIMKLKDAGQKSRMQFASTSTVTKAKVFLAKYSMAGVAGASNQDSLTCAEVELVEGANVDKKLLIAARDSVTAEILRFVIPAYLVSEDLVLVMGPGGERLDNATGQGICDDWKTANTLTNDLIFLSGTPVQRP